MFIYLPRGVCEIMTLTSALARASARQLITANASVVGHYFTRTLMLFYGCPAYATLQDANLILKR